MVANRIIAIRIILSCLLWCGIFIPVYTIKNVYFGYNFQSVDLCVNNAYIQNKICPRTNGFVTQCYQIHVNYKYIFDNNNYYCDIEKEQSFDTPTILQTMITQTYSNTTCIDGYFRKVDIGMNNACYFDINFSQDIFVMVTTLACFIFLTFAFCSFCCPVFKFKTSTPTPSPPSPISMSTLPSNCDEDSNNDNPTINRIPSNDTINSAYNTIVKIDRVESL